MRVASIQMGSTVVQGIFGTNLFPVFVLAFARSQIFEIYYFRTCCHAHASFKQLSTLCDVLKEVIHGLSMYRSVSRNTTQFFLFFDSFTALDARHSLSLSKYYCRLYSP